MDYDFRLQGDEKLPQALDERVSVERLSFLDVVLLEDLVAGELDLWQELGQLR